MSEQIDPGEGFRLLEIGEKIPKSAEYFNDSRQWEETSIDGELVPGHVRKWRVPIEKHKPDPNAVAVADLILTRSQKGVADYGTDTTRQDVDSIGWAKHAQEELCDAAVYLHALVRRLEAMQAEMETLRAKCDSEYARGVNDFLERFKKEVNAL